MNTIPLVKGNTQEEINTSLIALKKALDEMNSSSSKTDASVQSQIKQINELITNINSHLDTIDGQITDLQPVDTVALNNMQSVTSNAVARTLDSSKDWILLTATTENDEHLTVPNLTQYKELLLTLNRNDGRVCGSSVIPVNVFHGGGVYAIGINSLTPTLTEYGVAVWESNTQIEIAGTYYQARFFGR